MIGQNAALTGLGFAVACLWLQVQASALPGSVFAEARSSCSGPSPDNPSTYWYEAIAHNGQASFMNSAYKADYKVFRNVVTDFGADNTGAKDASAAIQAAVNAAASNGGPGRTTGSLGSTGQPAVVYIPPGTYLMTGSVQLFVGTVLIGDALNPPVLKASSSFPNDHIIYGKDPNYQGTINFYITVKNLVLDSTSVPASQNIALIDWTVSQATQLTNVVFNMSDYSNHVGVTSQYGYNSNTILNDLSFFGGAFAMDLSGQQWILKGISIIGAHVGIRASAFSLVCLECSFQYGDTGIDATSISGSLTVIDSTGNALGTLIRSSSSPSTTAGNSIVLDNVQYSGQMVTYANNDAILSGGVASTWVHGNVYRGGSTTAQNFQNLFLDTPRSSTLLAGSSSQYFTMAPPSYAQYSSAQFVNIKSVQGLPVLGDGVTDDTANINAILSQSAGCKIVYFPAGTYLVSGTVFVSAGSRIIGDAYASAISATGSFFSDASAPQPMVQVGNAGDIGVAQITDMLFTVADILPGCLLVEVNIAGSSPGAVGFWNSHFRVGGAVGSKVETACPIGGNPASCMAAWGILHLTKTSSVYIQGMWGWTADHDMDNLASPGQTISTGRGMLIEATQGTWLVGTAIEHNTLYQYNFEYAQNVFSAFQQSETPYWQGTGTSDIAPAPWTNSLVASDPAFDNCAVNDALCRMALFERIRGSSNLFLYGGCDWAFFNNDGSCSGNCQQNAIRIQTSPSVYLYGTNVNSITNIILEDTIDAATESANQGGWGGVVAAYIHSSSVGVLAATLAFSPSSTTTSTTTASSTTLSSHSSASFSAVSSVTSSLPADSPASLTPTATSTATDSTLTDQPAADASAVVVVPSSQ